MAGGGSLLTPPGLAFSAEQVERDALKKKTPSAFAKSPS